MEIGANVGTAFASQSPKAAYQAYLNRELFLIQVKVCILENLFNFTPSKWYKKHQDYTLLHH